MVQILLMLKSLFNTRDMLIMPKKAVGNRKCNPKHRPMYDITKKTIGNIPNLFMLR